MQQKVWSCFTKPQRKSITQWKDHIQVGVVTAPVGVAYRWHYFRGMIECLRLLLQEIRTEINQATKFPGDKDDELPESKKIKLETSDGKFTKQKLCNV